MFLEQYEIDPIFFQLLFCLTKKVANSESFRNKTAYRTIWQLKLAF